MLLGRMSLNFLIELIPPGTKLTIASEKKNHTYIFGRTLVYAYLPDGRCINKIIDN